MGTDRGGVADLFAFARSEWRGRWRSMLLLTALTAVTLGVAVAVSASASRATTAFDRLRAATHASDASVFVEDASSEDALAVANGIEGVVDARAEAELFVRPEGSELFPNFTLLALAPVADDGPGAVNTPVISRGRAPDPAQPHEVALSEELAAELGVGPGDEIALESMTDAWIEEVYAGGVPGPPDGPRMQVTVTGLARTAAEFGQRPNVIHLTPAFVERYRGELRAYDQIHVRIEPEVIARVLAGDMTGFEEVEMEPSPFFDSATTEDGLGTIATALRLFAGVAVLAGGVVTLLALSRVAKASTRDRTALSAIGWTRGRHAQAVVLVFAPWILAGVAIGLVVGVAVSPEAMVGLAAAVEPEPDAVIVSGGLVATSVTLALLVAGLLLLLVAGSVVRGDRRTAPGAVPVRGVALAQPLPAWLGARNALFGTPDQGVRASRASLAAMIVGLAAAIAALVVSASIGLLQADPSLSGQGDERAIDSGEALDMYERAMPVLAEDDRVAVLAAAHIAFGVTAEGAADVPMVALEVVRGDPDLSLVAGRAPSQPDEVAIGPATLDALGADVGDSITLRTEESEEDFRVVGAALFPEGDFRHDEGFAVTVAGGDRLIGDAVHNSAIHQVLFDWAPGVDVRAAEQELRDRGFPVLDTDTGLAPPTVTNLGQVEGLPRYLALFIAVLCLTALAHATWVAVRLRSKDLSTLRAIGLTPRATAAVVWCQALVIVVLALVLAVPLGFALGRQVWRPIAERAHVVVRADLPWSWVLTSVTAVLAVGVGLAALSGVRALRVRPSVQLRAE